MVEEKKAVKPKIQSVLLENRQKMNISGVVDIISFNEENVVADTELGILVVRGEGLHINRLNLESSELNIEGEITGFDYDDRETRSKSGGFWSRMFR